MIKLSHIPGIDYLFIIRKISVLYQRRFGRYPNLLSPKTFNERIAHRIVFDRDPRLPILCDKLRVKEFIAGIVGEAYNVPTLGVWQQPEDIDLDALPERFVLKPNHSSGPIAIVTDAADRNPQTLKALAREWLSRDFYDTSLEWAYRGIPRRLLAEPLLQPAEGDLLVEAQAYAFGGRVALIRLLRGGKLTGDRSDCWFDATGRRVDIAIGKLSFDGTLEERDRAGIVALADALAAGFSSLRVDFYLTDQGIKVGELTPYSFGGRRLFIPRELDPLLGKLWEKDFDLACIPSHRAPA